MSTEQKYRELTPGEVIQPGDEWMDFQGNWHRGMTNSMGDAYRPEPDGRGMTYHCRHRRPLPDWEALYRVEVIAKNEWKERCNNRTDQINEVLSQRDALSKKLLPRCLQSIAALPSGEVGSMYSNDAKSVCDHIDELRQKLEESREVAKKLIEERDEARENNPAFSAFAGWIKAALDAAGAPDLHPDKGAPHRKPMTPQERIKALADERDQWKQQYRTHLEASHEFGLASRNHAHDLKAEIANLKDVLADANKNYRLIEAENLSLNVQIGLARGMLNGQEKRHKDEVAKLNANYLQVMVERDQLRAMTTPPESWMPKPPQNLREDIIHAINCRSAENGSNTPDWILGDFLMASLAAFDAATNARTNYYPSCDNSPETDPPATTVG